MRTDGKITLPCEAEVELDKLREMLARQGYDIVRREPVMTFESFRGSRR